ncbi:hypothetical protein KGV55_02505 [Candidatus Gracilibacteria bacterium]|nr:hypothetical protein [Candidatus Gracilibacteria bacterium]
MSDGVFFAVSPLLWEDIPHFWVFFCVSFIFFSMIFLFQKNFIAYKKKKAYLKNIPTSLPAISEPDFEQKIFIALKGIIAKKFMPAHSFSHTNLDILSYCHDSQLKEIWETLETTRYKNTTLSAPEKEKIRNILLKKL